MSSSGTRCRRCSRQTCTRDAVMTLTYVYSDSTAVVGPLAGHAEPHAYDLCSVHADRLTVPRGWKVVRLELPETRARREDIGAVAEAVREDEPHPSAPVRGRSRTVLRDVSLPRTAGPAQRPGRETGPPPRAARDAGSGPAVRPAREAEPVRGAGSVREAESAREPGPARRQDRDSGSAARRAREAEPVREARSARQQGREVASVPRAHQETAPGSRPVRETVAGPVRDVPMPEGLYRAHLRRPAGGADRARPAT